MPKQNEEPVSAIDILKALTQSQPEVYTVVCRKANIGNFETIDVGVGVKLPVEFREALTVEQFDEIKEAVAASAELGFSIASQETFDRYIMIKEQIAGGS